MFLHFFQVASLSGLWTQLINQQLCLQSFQKQMYLNFPMIEKLFCKFWIIMNLGIQNNISLDLILLQS